MNETRPRGHVTPSIDRTITQQLPQHSHSHYESTSTQTSDSTDSSPTTTISTVESPSMSDPSPSSAPESPMTLVPLSSFSGSTFGLDSFQSLNMIDSNTIRIPTSDERPMTSPLPRKRNPKALALNLNPNVDSPETSEPTSPSFIKPPPLKARKKPSLLSLNTGAANKLSLGVESLASPGIPNMLQRRGLKHSISSPQILATPGMGPSGGMTLGRPLAPSRFKDLSLTTKTFTINEDLHEPPAGVQMATRVPGKTVGGDSFDRPHTGEDAKSPSYPDGPILMHEPSVHLYLEPKVEEALQFDVVINVAREVKNPFKVLDEEKTKSTQQHLEPPPLVITPAEDDKVPDSGMSNVSYQTAFDIQPPSSNESSPTTPRPAEAHRPEYIHMPWDHNTDVKDELWDLCQLIESRTSEGKKVLVHCQQGASRSATLIIAYGMYINKDIGPTEAYKMAQNKSRWVNPNMSLLFSLNDFKKIVDERKSERKLPIRKAPTKHRSSLSANTLDSTSTTSRARGNSTPSPTVRDQALSRMDDSPLPTHSALERLGGFDFGFGEITISNQRTERDKSRERSAPLPQPSIPAPPQRQAPEPPRAVSHEPFGIPPRVSLVPFHSDAQRAVSHDFPRPLGNYWEDLMSPRITEMTNNPLQSFSRSFGSVEEVPPTPGLFSPLVEQFPRTSFFPTPEVQAPPLPPVVDPRSPPTKGEAPITRSIDDFL